MEIRHESLREADASFIPSPIPIDRVLYEAEQPIIFLSHTSNHQMLLCYLADETQNARHLILSAITPDRVAMLESGTISVRDALTAGWMWLATAPHNDDQLLSLWHVTESDIPQEHLPTEGTPLLPEHQVVFSARAVGDRISLGQMPCSVIGFVASAAKSSLKSVLDHFMESHGQGRPTDAQRALYDLPVQRLRFASFEIGFSSPPTDMFPNETLTSVINSLESGLTWAEDARQDTSLPGTSNSETEALLRATLALTPPLNGAITSVEISGSWLRGQRYQLTRDSRRKVSNALRRFQAEEIVICSGRIGEIDDDNLGFTLRETDDQAELKGTFSEDILDDMRLYYYESRRVKVSGVKRGNRLFVTAVIEDDARHP